MELLTQCCSNQPFTATGVGGVRLLLDIMAWLEGWGELLSRDAEEEAAYASRWWCEEEKRRQPHHGLDYHLVTIRWEPLEEEEEERKFKFVQSSVANMENNP